MPKDLFFFLFLHRREEGFWFPPSIVLQSLKIIAPNIASPSTQPTCYSSGRDELLIGFNVAAAFSLASVNRIFCAKEFVQDSSLRRWGIAQASALKSRFSLLVFANKRIPRAALECIAAAKASTDESVFSGES
ncbi:hypothetical protein D5086_000043 [Populus alba]|uniref:Uncharacterized protein n=1 Tax=Populus alba TaxID=43335 RepID=A0ACC4CUQ1_POPAL